MKKIKSYTLIEVVIASFIFMVVSVMATVSFGMIRSANEKAATLKNAGECREILQNYLKSEVTNSTSDPRIMGVTNTSGVYKLVKITAATLRDPVSTDRFIGIALFQPAGQFKVIYKDQENPADPNSPYRYYFAQMTNPTGTLDITASINSKKSELLKNGSQIGCVASGDTTSLKKPFTILAVGSDAAHTFKISLADKIYTEYGTAVPDFGSDNKNFAATQAEAVNSDQGI